MSDMPIRFRIRAIAVQTNSLSSGEEKCNVILVRNASCGSFGHKLAWTIEHVKKGFERYSPYILRQELKTGRLGT